jgi:hypothetical protein
VAIGAEFGLTHFFSRDYCNQPMPTSIYQSGIYPFRTDYSVCPGLNWQFGLKMQAYHFLDRLSCYFQYMIVTHRNDSIKLKKCDPAFKPETLECRSCWQTQFGNIGFYYDISPAITLGMLWQAPFKQKGVYVVQRCYSPSRNLLEVSFSINWTKHNKKHKLILYKS